MTCIVGLVDHGTVYMGGDSVGAADSWSLTIRKDAKVFLNQGYLMGFTSSFRMGQLLRYAFMPPTIDERICLEKFMATTFIDAVRDCLKVGGYAQKNNEQEKGGCFLVGVRGRLFTIYADYQVGEALSGYDAVGIGDDIARGALFASSCLGARRRIELALKAAEQHNIGVRGPFIIEALEDFSR